MTTPSIQYAYANGSANTVRPTSVTSPNGRAVTYDYGTSGGIDDSASRVASLVDSDGASTHLADYSYLGLGTVVQQDSPEADLRYTLVSLTGANDPDTGDIYAGLDRFGRVQDVRWRDVSAATDLSRIQYGYDRASNRTWRANPTDPSQHFDWLYGYDGLQRLKAGNRGTLNGTQTAITDPQFGQCWTLDPTGNWSALQQSDDGTTWAMKQSRTSNPVNEITAINGTVGELWATPQYDANGNMTTIPRPDLERPNWANLTVDQWATLTKEEWAELEVAPKFAATYDAWNRLTKLVDAGNGETVQENQYDGRNYRTVTKTYTNGSLVETRHHYYTDNWQCVEERLGSSTTPDRQFVWGVRYIDDLICRDRSVSGTLDERLYGCQDANWNLAATINTSGAVQERYEYDPYGDVTFLSPSFGVRAASSYDWETLYAGYRWDVASRLYAVRFRIYHPKLGVWCQRDLLRAVNPYKYGASALNAIDPFGLALVAIDGTSQEDWLTNPKNPQTTPGGRRMLSHVWNFWSDYEGPAEYDYGATDWFNASDLPKKMDRLFKWACNEHCKGEKIDLIGWSRGAVAVMDIARRLGKEGCCCKPSKVKHSVNVRFLGLYDPVDKSGHIGDKTNLVSNNVEKALNIFGKEPDDGYKGRDRDSWKRETGGVNMNDPNAAHSGIGLNATHGAIGGTPGYSSDQPDPYNWKHDREQSILADMLMRKRAKSVGVPIPVLRAEDYDFPMNQTDLIPVKKK